MNFPKWEQLFASRSDLSSSSVQGVLLTEGSRLLCQLERNRTKWAYKWKSDTIEIKTHRSRHCLPVLPCICSATAAHCFGPISRTSSRIRSSSYAGQTSKLPKAEKKKFRRKINLSQTSFVHGPFFKDGSRIFLHRSMTWFSSLPTRSIHQKKYIEHTKNGLENKSHARKKERKEERKKEKPAINFQFGSCPNCSASSRISWSYTRSESDASERLPNTDLLWSKFFWRALPTNR